MARAYGVLNPVGFSRRWTFYIGPDGRVRAIDQDVHATTAGIDIAARLDELDRT